VGPTSHDVVGLVRRLSATRRVGHGGTLDPFASGVLPLFLGKATRLVEYHLGDRKRYRATVCFGASSTTDDLEGALTPSKGPVPTRAAVEAALAGSRGPIDQRPPAYSAIKIGGERAYKAARRGEDVDVPERTVHVQRFEQLERAGGRARFAIECSSGTYVRSLIADLGDAYCLTLRRTRIGPFDVADADPDRVVGLGEALARIMPVVDLDSGDARAAAHGRAIAVVAPAGADAILLRDGDGPVAIASPREDGEVKPVVGFRA